MSTSRLVAPPADPDAELQAARTSAGLLDLTARGICTLVGPDARRWSNGQFTNNVRDLAVGRWNSSAMVDDKAKVQGLLDLWCLDASTFLVALDGVTPEAFEARYAKFIIFDDLELTDVSEDYALLSVQGPQAGAVLAALSLPRPEPGAHTLADNGWRVAEHARSIHGGYDVLVPAPEAVAAAEALTGAGARLLSPEAAERLRVEAGLPRWPEDFGEKALPHEMRLVERMCSFSKGCYIGQEVINRIDVMGQVQKKIWGLVMAEVPPPQSPITLNGAAVGHTLTGAREGGEARVLAILRKAAWTPGLEVTVEGAGTARVSDLPFGQPS